LTDRHTDRHTKPVLYFKITYIDIMKIKTSITNDLTFSKVFHQNNDHTVKQKKLPG